jgi:hypothetical protein
MTANGGNVEQIDTTATLAFWTEHRNQLRQSEDQRAILTNFLLVIISTLSGLIIQQKFALRTLPLCILIVGIGLYGAATTAKYHERATYHLTQARALAHVLQANGALGDNQDVLRQAREKHYRSFPRLSRLRLHQLWTGLHIAIAVYGLTLAFIMLLR